MIKKLLVATSLIFAFNAEASDITKSIEKMPKGEYKIDESHASLTFKISHLGLANYTARFTSIEAVIDLEPKDITKSRVIAFIDPASIKTDYPYPKKKDFDKELATSSDWLDSKKFPEIKFVSTKIIKTGKDTAKIYGDLTFRGVTKEVVLNTKFNGAYLRKPFSTDPAIGFSATAKIKRSDFGFSTYIPMIGDEVEILIETEFNKK